MNVKNERLAFRPSGPVRMALDDLHAITGKSRASLISEMLDGVAPLFVEQLKLLQQVADHPHKARELVQEFGMQGINTISQQLLDLPPVRPKRGRPRKHAAP
jgi:hypothetical protein